MATVFERPPLFSVSLGFSKTTAQLSPSGRRLYQRAAANVSCHKIMAAKKSRLVHPESAKEMQLKNTAAMEQKMEACLSLPSKGNPAN